jgi:hypothetical protein
MMMVGARMGHGSQGRRFVEGVVCIWYRGADLPPVGCGWFLDDFGGRVMIVGLLLIHEVCASSALVMDLCLSHEPI